MKSKIKNLVILLGLIISSLIFTKPASAQQENVSFQVFYDQLSPYGQWIDHPNWGYVWIPNVEEDFAPYSTNGYWVLSDYGWTWVSDYDWGWAPFHYGRWNFDSYYGWLWVPDNQWGPAWVTWRRADGYYGWMPMQSGISITISFGSRYNSNYDHWMFVRDHDLDRRDIYRYSVNKTDHDRILRRSSVINKTYTDYRRNSTYVSGPTIEDVQKVEGRTIKPVSILDNNKPGQNLENGQLRMYRPTVTKISGNANKPAPTRIFKRDDVKQPSERVSPSNTRNVNQQQQRVIPAQKSTPPTNVKRKQETTQPQKAQTEKEKKSGQEKKRID